MGREFKSLEELRALYVAKTIGRCNIEDVYRAFNGKRYYLMCVYKCNECGRTGKTRLHRVLGTPQIACRCQTDKASSECHAKHLDDMVFGFLTVLKRIKRNYHGYHSYLVECGMCGRTKIMHSTSIRKSTSCGCQHQFSLGESHPNWRGGHTHPPRTEPEYKEWRMKVFERDGFVCRKCKMPVDGEIRAHHIKSYTRFKDERYLIDNGITLCEGCHGEFHHLYGIMRFTEDDFWKWFNDS